MSHPTNRFKSGLILAISMWVLLVSLPGKAEVRTDFSSLELPAKEFVALRMKLMAGFTNQKGTVTNGDCKTELGLNYSGDFYGPTHRDLSKVTKQENLCFPEEGITFGRTKSLKADPSEPVKLEQPDLVFVDDRCHLTGVAYGRPARPGGPGPKQLAAQTGIPEKCWFKHVAGCHTLDGGFVPYANAPRPFNPKRPLASEILIGSSFPCTGYWHEAFWDTHIFFNVDEAGVAHGNPTCGMDRRGQHIKVDNETGNVTRVAEGTPGAINLGKVCSTPRSLPPESFVAADAAESSPGLAGDRAPDVQGDTIKKAGEVSPVEARQYQHGDHSGAHSHGASGTSEAAE